MRAIEVEMERIQGQLVDRFGSNLIGLILYGSWAKGTAREESDLDLLAIFSTCDREAEKSLLDLERSTAGRNVTLVPASVADFQKERIPLYTAVKKEGKVLYGGVDRSINPEPPEDKYAEFFERSREFESQKVKIAEELLAKGLGSGSADFCYVASKHAIQAALAMKGEGYSSKMAVLAPLAEKHFGKEIGTAFKDLFRLYVKSEYGLDFLTVQETRAAIDWAKKVLRVYEFQPATGIPSSL